VPQREPPGREQQHTGQRQEAKDADNDAKSAVAAAAPWAFARPRVVTPPLSTAENA